MESVHYNKYIKYKTKYLKLKEQSGGNCEYIAPRKPYVNNYEILQYGIVSVPTYNIDGKTLNENPGPYQQIRTNDRNSKYITKINNIHKQLIIILENLIKDKTSKGIFYGYNNTGNSFKTILEEIIKLNSEYTIFFNSITNVDFNYDGDLKYRTDKETYFKNLSKTYINKIYIKENVIKTIIQKIVQNDKLNNLINNEINTKINLENNNIIDIDKKYYNKGLCSLQNIITFYFYNILDGLEFSLPAFKIFKNKT